MNKLYIKIKGNKKKGIFFCLFFFLFKGSAYKVLVVMATHLFTMTAATDIAWHETLYTVSTGVSTVEVF